MKKLAWLLLFYSPFAWADPSAFLNVSVGVFNSGKNSLSETKLLKMGVEEDIWYNFKQRFSGGFWLDNAGSDRKSSGFGAYQWGFDVKNDTLEAGVWSGPAFITTPDEYLGGRFQFNETLYVGICDHAGNSIGATYNHFSSAGIEFPNIGRDFVGAEIKFPF